MCYVNIMVNGNVCMKTHLYTYRTEDIDRKILLKKKNVIGIHVSNTNNIKL